MLIKTTRKLQNGKEYSYRFLAESYWDKKKKQPRHRIIANISRLPDRVIELLRRQLKDEPLVSSDEIVCGDAYDHGAEAVFLRLAERTGLEEILRKTLGKQAERLIAMIINRIADPKAKYSLRDWLSTTTLPRLLGKPLDYFHYNRCYEALDGLDKEQNKIEDSLRGKPNTLLLYDLTSSYFEGDGENNQLSDYGYNRDRKKGKKQVVIGLATDKEGRPLAVEVLPGNTGDRSVLKKRVDNLKQRFGIEEVIIVFDRGMATASNKLALVEKKVDYITALTPDEIKKLAKDNQELQLGLFDKKDLLRIKVVRETREGEKYEEKLILCRSEQKARRDKQQFMILVKKTEDRLKMIQGMIKKGRLKDQVKIAKRAGRWLNHWKVGRYFETEIKKGSLVYRKKKVEFDKQDMISGMYALATSTDKLEPKEVQEAYKSLPKVEADFRVLKSSLKIRPIYHWKEERIKAHVFVCFLALWLAWHFEKKLAPLWEKYTRSQVESELKKLKAIRLLPKTAFTGLLLKKPTRLHKQICRCLKIPLFKVTKI